MQTALSIPLFLWPETAIKMFPCLKKINPGSRTCPKHLCLCGQVAATCKIAAPLSKKKPRQILLSTQLVIALQVVGYAHFLTRLKRTLT